MKVDKQNGNVCYNDEEHIYWNEKDNGKYISVTTLIGMNNHMIKNFGLHIKH